MNVAPNVQTVAYSVSFIRDGIFATGIFGQRVAEASTSSEAGRHEQISGRAIRGAINLDTWLQQHLLQLISPES
jgi:hypothetical protein